MVKQQQVEKHILDLSRTDNSCNGKVRVTVHSHNIKPSVLNIYAEFDSDIP